MNHEDRTPEITTEASHRDDKSLNAAGRHLASPRSNLRGGNVVFVVAFLTLCPCT